MSCTWNPLIPDGLRSMQHCADVHSLLCPHLKKTHFHMHMQLSLHNSALSMCVLLQTVKRYMYMYIIHTRVFIAVFLHAEHLGPRAPVKGCSGVQMIQLCFPVQSSIIWYQLEAALPSQWKGQTVPPSQWKDAVPSAQPPWLMTGSRLHTVIGGLARSVGRQ